MPGSGSKNSGSKFNENEKLLCYHGPLLYEAKCVKVKRDSKESAGYSYYVHYQGWNKNWDEWVNETRMLKINPDSKGKQKELLSAHLAATKESKSKSKNTHHHHNKTNPKKGSNSSNSRASTPVSEKSLAIEQPPLPPSSSGSTPNNPPPSKKRKEDNERLTKFKIWMPEELRYVLANDWDLMTVKKNLFNLPAKLTISQIIDEYLSSNNCNVAPSSSKKNIMVISEVLKGVKDLFNNLIGNSFLYDIERKQFNGLVVSEEKEYTDIYGPPHLLRVLSKIDTLLNYTRIEVDPDVALIETIIGDFLKYLEDNMGKLFTSKNYKEATEEYLKSNEITS